MKARIYRPSKSAMQSGRAKTHAWVFEYTQAAARPIDPLMGWNGGTDTTEQIRLSFATREEAIEYARRIGVDFTVQEPKTMTQRPKAYADNFRFDRIKTN